MSLTIDGKPLKQLDLALLPGFQHPAAPPVRDYTVSIPGRPGAYYFGSDIDPLEFNLPLIIKPQEDRYKLATAIRKMVTAFIDPYGKPKEVKLIYDYEPDKYYLARYSGSMPIERYLRMGKFELPMIAYDPHAYSVMKSTDKITWGTRIPYATQIAFSYKAGQSIYNVNSPQSLLINNIGSLVVRPVIEIIGKAIGLTLTINGESFSFGDLNSETLLIDAESYTVIKQGKNYLFNTTGNLEKLELFPGKNTAKIGGENLNIKITFNFRGKY
ncbi:phage tail protein [Bacillus sp. N35-10-4]|uniref:distal tail protein Dit n=1 Tax=Bacillus sp. N35-10-4 TaxID=1866315 RepID=UPI0008FDB881|nr:distal tail protein Dit [Bacillus sp. N35-10-4]OJD66204.1 phage tail protein [Bacillus sp. N35-10-4]